MSSHVRVFARGAGGRSLALGLPRSGYAAGAAGAAVVASAVSGVLLTSEHSHIVFAAERPGRFAGAVVVVTGAGGNFGRAGAAYFKKEGAQVVLLDAVEKPLRETEKELSAVAGPKCVAKVCDITSDAAVAEAVAFAEQSFGKITHLWNNAGYQGAMKMTHEYPIDDFKLVQDVNVTGNFRVLQAVARSMMKSGGGVIVNTASVAGLRGSPTMPAYVASKAAIIGLTMSVAKDLAPYNIRVNAISPALIGPGFMWDRQNELQAMTGSPYYSNDPETLAKNKVGSVPMKRLGSIDEVIHGVAFLMSEDSSYITGTNLIIDGGFQMR